MAYVPELMERLRRETEAGLRERLAEAEAAVEALHQALIAEVTERFANVVLSEDDIHAYIAEEYGIERVKNTPTP